MVDRRPGSREVSGAEKGSAGPGAVAISVRGVGKRFRIYPTPVDRLRDALGWKARFKEFDALRDVSFDIRRGEFWGIVGRNGSGKSTLLRIIAGQTRPTAGSVVCRGEVSLLQLGLGFDPELTGLENIRQSRLLQHLRADHDEIVDFVRDFSELGDFIEYPVKTYSSGMYSRLAFAVAIAGDPDILIADEVLAVGDMNFAQKCLAKMREFKERGKTVVLVTHDTDAVKSFCDKAVWLHDGRVMALGGAKMVAEDYRNFMLYGVTSTLNREEAEAAAGEARGAATGVEEAAEDCGGSGAWITPTPERHTVSTGAVEILRYRFWSVGGRRPVAEWQVGEEISFDILFRACRAMLLHSFAFVLHDRRGMVALHLNSEFFGMGTYEVGAGEVQLARFQFRVPPLAAGPYSVSLGCSEGEEGRLVEKYDYDCSITVSYGRDALPVTARQGGYCIVREGCFRYERGA